MRSTATETAVPTVASVEDQLAAFFDVLRTDGPPRGLICRDGAIAEDAVQAATEQAWKRRSSLRGIDLRKPEFWQAGLQIIDQQVEQYLAL